MYKIKNLQTNYTLFESPSLRRANEVFYKVLRRRCSTIALIDSTTREILKAKTFRGPIFKCSNFIKMLKGAK